jgi:tRNA threonylcarbamoyladenosine biosynthesis protein TsaE
MKTAAPTARLTVATASPAQTKKLGARLAPLLDAGDVVLFEADLGAGKTTFVQGVAAALGAEDAALSPTFVVAETIAARVPIHHLDFYRLTLPEILGMGVEDYLNGAGEIGPGVVLIEWAERFRKIWPSARLEIGISIGRGKNRRTFAFRGVGERPADLVRRLKAKTS